MAVNQKAIGCKLEIRVLEKLEDYCAKNKSHPSWVCGLKPFTTPGILYRYARHTLRGCVD